MNAPHPVEQPDEFRAWTLLYLERQLSVDEEREFVRILEGSETASRMFAEAAQFDAELYELRSQETLVGPRAPKRPVEERKRPWGAALIAAGLLIAMVLGAVLTRPPPARPAPQARIEVEPEPEPPLREPEPLPESPRPDPKEEAFILPEPERKVEKRVEIAPPEPPPADKKAERAPVVEKRAKTVARMGRLERVQGPVWILAGRSRIDARVGMDLAPGQGIQTGRDATASFAFGDGTRLDLAPETTLRDVAEAPHKQAQLAHGMLAAEVARQPVGAPMKLATAHAELTIVGTAFVLTAEPKATRLHVKEGQVRLSRKKDGAVLEVPAGNAASVAEGVDFSLRTMRPAALLRGRSTVDLEALYLFNEGKGGVIEDVSGAGESLDLKVRDESAVKWLPRGLLVHSPTALVSARPAAKIAEACRKSHELTVEAWIMPASAAQIGPARILSLSAGPAARDFTLGQGEDNGPNPSRFTMRLRTTSTGEAGMPGIMSDEGVVKVGLTHLVVARNRAGSAAFYVDGLERGRQPVGGDFSKWKEYRLALADEPAPEGGQTWLGAYYLVAIYSRALSAEDVAQHFRAGPTGLRAR